ncbi:MAG: hypothetical protein ACRD6W_03940 [Nitrososphaerales archaeon]
MTIMEKFESYKSLSAEEKAQVKTVHKGIRAETSSRAGNLAWAFVRGFPYRRVERSTRTQTMPDGTVVVHNAPNPLAIARILAAHMPELEALWFESKYRLKDSCPLAAWLANPDGAIPAPAPRPKRVYVRPEAGSAA